jgi:hypothetical protein
VHEGRHFQDLVLHHTAGKWLRRAGRSAEDYLEQVEIGGVGQTWY